MTARRSRRLAARRGELKQGVFDRERWKLRQRRRNGRLRMLAKVRSKHPLEERLRRIALGEESPDSRTSLHLSACQSCYDRMAAFRRQAEHVADYVLRDVAHRQRSLTVDQEVHIERCAACSERWQEARTKVEGEIRARHLQDYRIQESVSEWGTKLSDEERLHLELCAECRTKHARAEADESQRRAEARRREREASYSSSWLRW